MLIILDRDGVLNEDSPNYIKSPDEWLVIPGSLEAVARLNNAGHTVVLATNQSGINRGLYSEQTLEKIHQKMLDAMKEVGAHLDGIYFCPHRPDENCDCRKPQPGMLLQIAKDFDVDVKQAIFIGDHLRDVQAARAAGCTPILLLTGYGEEVAKDSTEMRGVAIYKNLAEAVEALLE